MNRRGLVSHVCLWIIALVFMIVVALNIDVFMSFSFVL